MLTFLALIDDPAQRSLCEKLYYDCKDDMLRIAAAALRDASDAEDVVHDVFVYIARNAMSKLQTMSESRQRRYLLIAAKHRALNANRSKRKYDTAYEDEAVRRSERVPNTDFMRAISENETVREVEAALNELDQIYREVLYLRFFNGMRGREIAALLNISESAVWKRVERGKRMLVDLLKGGRTE